MNYIDQKDYSNMLKNFAKGSAKGLLEESAQSESGAKGPTVNTMDKFDVVKRNGDRIKGVKFIDTRTYVLNGVKTSLQDTDSVEKSEGMKAEGSAFTTELSGGQGEIAAMAPPEDEINAKDFEVMRSMKKEMAPARSKYENLSQDERNELKQYIESVKEIQGAIKELVDKAKGMQETDTTERILVPEESVGNDPVDIDELINKFESKFGELPDDSREAFKIAIEMDYEGGGLSKATMDDLVQIFDASVGQDEDEDDDETSDDTIPAIPDGLTSSEQQMHKEKEALHAMGIDSN